MKNDLFTPNLFLRNQHVNTIAPNLWRKVKVGSYKRIRYELDDGDFIDFDCINGQNDTVVLMLHGLEGNSQRPYMLGMAKMALANNWDVVAMNHRGCSGEANRLLSAYHSGKTEDLEHALIFINSNWNYKDILIAGFSLGGNIVLKYAGEKGTELDSRIKAFAAVSVPVQLHDSAQQLKKGFNKVYMARFMKTLKAKGFEKLKRFPDAPFTFNDVKNAKTFHDFDDFFTGPVHGFTGAEDYWQKSSSRQFLPLIAKPTLLINALDDPFLGRECFPYEEATANTNFILDTPKYGGHVGFVKSLVMKKLYSEIMVESFFKSVL